LKFIIYTTDQAAARAGTGVYSESEWGDARKRIEFKDLAISPTMANYEALMAHSDTASKIASAELLLKRFDICKYRRLGDLGGNPYPQSWVISRSCPNLEFVLSDYDQQSNATLRAIPGYFAREVRDVDLKNGPLDAFEQCDAVTMWGVDYALSDVELVRLYSWFSARKIDFLLCSPSMRSWLGGMRLVLGHIVRKIRGVPDRPHGWARTPGHMLGLVRTAGATVAEQQRILGYDVWLIRRA